MDRDNQNGVFDPDAEIEAAMAADTPATEPEVEADEPVGDAGQTSTDLAGTMRWSEFNRRNEEIKREREAIEARERDFQARAAGYADYEEFTRTVQANPALAQDIQAAFERHQPQMRQTVAVPPEIEKLKTELKAELDEVRNDRVERTAERITAEVDALRVANKLTAAQALEVRDAALKAGDIGMHTKTREEIGRKLRMIYRDMYFDKAKGQGERELAGKLREGQRAAAPGGKPRGSEADDAEPTYDASMSYDQIAAAEIKRWKGR